MLGPTVSVDAEPADAARDELRRFVALRVLQEGYDVTADRERADARVHVRVREEGTEVSVQGATATRSFAVEPGPAALQRLEVLHRTLIGIEAVAQPDPEAIREPGLSLSLSEPSDQAEPLMAAMVAAALADGRRVTTDAHPDDTLVCITPRGELAEIAIGPAVDGCAPATAVVSLTDDVDASARDVVQQSQAPALVLPEPSPPPAEPRADPIVEDASVPPPDVGLRRDDEVPLQGPPRAGLRLGMEGGIVARAPTVDATVRTRVRAGAYDGVGGRLELAVIPSSNANIRVVDTILAVGPDWQHRLGKRGGVHLAATVGADIHTYAIDSWSAADVSWVCGLPLSASVALRGDTRMHLSVLPEVTGVATTHDVNGDEIWRRSAWRIGAAVGFSYGWRIE